MAKTAPKVVPYTDEQKAAIVDHVVAELSGGRSVARILREDEGMPAPAQFWKWHAQDETIQEQVVRARENGIEAQLDEAIEIGDVVAADKDAVMKAKLRVETRIKMAQMLKPKKYGPKLDLTSDGKALGLSDAMRAAEKRVSED